MSRETPLQKVKRVYGDKDKLVAKVVAALRGDGDDQDDLEERLKAAPNSKLLRLAEITDAVKARFGSKDKLVAALSEAVGKAKDADYVAKLRTYSPIRLWDLWRSAERRTKAAAKADKAA
jgi:hypothetical protein